MKERRGEIGGEECIITYCPLCGFRVKSKRVDIVIGYSFKMGHREKSNALLDNK